MSVNLKMKVSLQEQTDSNTEVHLTENVMAICNKNQQTNSKQHISNVNGRINEIPQNGKSLSN
eukprot:m.368642 g.368642  ORF g.368642 m.368642 type:complete len:63 (-) comp46040_c0_seq1:59-247(-)